MKNKIIIVIYLVILSYLIGNYFSLERQFSIEYMNNVMILSGIGLICFILKNEPYKFMKGQNLTLSLLFLFGLIITCFQVYAMYLYGTLKDLSLGYYLDYSIVPISITISSMGLISYFLGFMTYKLKEDKINCKTINVKTYSTLLIQFCSVMCFIIFFLTIDKSYFKGNYGEIMNSGGIGRIPEIFQEFYLRLVSASIIVVSWNLHVKKNVNLTFWQYLSKYNVIFIVVMVIYSCLVVLSGDRGPLFSTVLLLFFSYIVLCRKKIGLIKVISFIVIGLFAMLFLNYLRALDYSLSFSNRFDEVFVRMIDSDSILLSFTNELAVIVRAQHALIMYVDKFDFIYFHGIVYPLLGLIPGLGMIYTNLLNIRQEDIVSPYIATNFMNSDHGMGTTCIGDLYLSFGIVSVIFFMFILGFLFRKIELSVYKNNSTKFIWWLSYINLISVSVGIGRGTVFGVFRTIIFSLILIVIIDKIEKRIRL